MTDCGKISLINGNDFEKIEFQYREFTQGVWLNSLQFLFIGYNDCGGMEVLQLLLSSSLSVPLLSLGKTNPSQKSGKHSFRNKFTFHFLTMFAHELK